MWYAACGNSVCTLLYTVYSKLHTECGMLLAAWKNPYMWNAMRFSVFSATTLQGPGKNMPPCQSVLQCSCLEVEHNDLMIILIAMAYKLILRKKMKKRKTPAAAWVIIHSTRKRTRYGCVEYDLMSIADAAKFMENPDQWCQFLDFPDQWHHFLDFPMQIHIRMAHESRHVAIHFLCITCHTQ